MIEFTKVISSEATGLLTTQSDLSLPLAVTHFHKGHLTAKCLASLLTMHWQSPGEEGTFHLNFLPDLTVRNFL